MKLAGGMGNLPPAEFRRAAERLPRCRDLAGFDLIEFQTRAEIDGITALAAARLLVNVIGRIVGQV